MTVFCNVFYSSTSPILGSSFMKKKNAASILHIPYNSPFFSVGAKRRCVAIVDFRMLRLSYKMRGHDSSVYALQWNPRQPNLLASGSDDGTVRRCHSGARFWITFTLLFRSFFLFTFLLWLSFFFRPPTAVFQNYW